MARTSETTVVYLLGERLESFISEMYARCDLLVRNWLRKREVWKELPAKITTRILDTVRPLLLKPVYSEMSLRQVAQMARVTEGSIFRLFGGRAGLNQCAMRDTLEKIRSLVRKLVSERGTARFTMQDVALGIGMSEDELSFLFGTREKLLEYVFSRSR